MPVHFTCRLIVVRTANGKFRVKYDYLGNGCKSALGGPIIVFHGPAMVQPPTEEMTDEELVEWQQKLWDAGFKTLPQPDELTAPLAEAQKTIEDEIPKSSVAWELFWVPNDVGERTLGVELRSRWQRPIPNLTLHAEATFPTPQPGKGEGMSPAWRVHDGGGSESFRRETAVGGKDLIPSTPTRFAAYPEFMQALLSRAAALSPEYHWISLRTDGHEFDRIPGSEVARFLESHE